METVAAWGLNLAYLMIALALIGVVVGLVLSIVQDLKSGIFAIGGLVLILVLFGIGYATSSADLPAKLALKGIGTDGSYKLSGAGLFTFYALAVIALIALVADVVKGFVDGN